MLIETNFHSESRDGEIFLRNVLTAGAMMLKEFELVKNQYSSARLGVMAYENGKVIVGQRPVFISRQEYTNNSIKTRWEK